MPNHKRVSFLKRIFVIIVLTLVFALILPARFMEYSFTCGFSSCDNADTSAYIVEAVHWQWFGGYHMSIWQHFTQKDALQDHWLAYNYRSVDVLVLFAQSFGVATAITLAYEFLRNKKH